MMEYAKIKNNINGIKLQKVIVASILIGFLSCILALALKRITEYYETIFYARANESIAFAIILPLVGLSVIYFLRQYLFKKKQNLGITEIFQSTESTKKSLPLYKVPSHFINGFLTVAMGGSTGIEVSTVVASAAIGSVAQRKENLFRQYKTPLICAGVAAGVTALFASPIAGILFSFEVIAKRKFTQTLFLTTILSAMTSYAMLFFVNEVPLMAMNIVTWHYKSLPWFVVLGMLSGLNSVYLTKCVIFFKTTFARIEVHYHKIILGAVLLSTLLILLPQLYGDGYLSMRQMFLHTDVKLTMSVALTLFGLIVLKPVATSITLASGGDGGVFAPSLFIGAFLGLFAATSLNTFFHVGVIPLNFMVIGMAAVLSASIHAPFTALFLICGIINDYTLFFPILMACLVSKYTAQKIYPYTVYSFVKKVKNAN